MDELKEEKSPEEKNCVPCKILAGAGLLISQYCNLESKDCNSLVDRVTNGKMTLRELAEELDAEEDYLTILQEEGTELDTKVIPKEDDESDDESQDKFCEIPVEGGEKNG